MCSNASRHGIRTHNALKALHLDELFGSGSGGCVPNAEIEIIGSKFKAVANLERQSQTRPGCRDSSDEHLYGTRR